MLAACIAQCGDIAIQRCGGAAFERGKAAQRFQQFDSAAPLTKVLAIDMRQQPRERWNVLWRFDDGQRGRQSVGDLLRMIAVVTPGRVDEGVEVHGRPSAPSISTSASISTGMSKGSSAMPTAERECAPRSGP